MAYNKEKLYNQAIKVATEKNLFWIEDIVAFLPCAKPTFYDHFPPESNELNNLKDILENNKIKTKASIRAKLYKSDKAAELLALYRLIATPEEHRLLNQSYVENKHSGEVKTTPAIIVQSEADRKALGNVIGDE
jgi:hypothetical protein